MDAWARYRWILNYCRVWGEGRKDALVLAALGATATVLAQIWVLWGFRRSTSATCRRAWTGVAQGAAGAVMRGSGGEARS